MRPINVLALSLSGLLAFATIAVAQTPWEPEHIGLDDDFEGRGEGSTDAILRGVGLPGLPLGHWDTVEGLQASSMLEIVAGSTLNIGAPSGLHVLTIDSDATENAMLWKDATFPLDVTCRYTNRWVRVSQPGEDWTGVHGWQNLGQYDSSINGGYTGSNNFPDRIWEPRETVSGNFDEDGDPSGGFRSAPQFYLDQEQTYTHPTDSAKDCANVVGMINGNHYGQDPRSVALDEQSDASTGSYQLPTDTFLYNETMSCSLHVNKWDTAVDGRADGDVLNPVPVRTYNQWFDSAGNQLLGPDDYYDQGSGDLGTYIGVGEGRRVTDLYSNDDECVWFAEINDFNIGNNGQQSNTLQEENVIILDDIRVGASDTQRPISDGEPWWPPRNGFDTDGDGVFDSEDNCTEVANISQFDTDQDGFGNRCDGDFDQSGLVAGSDFGLFLQSSSNPYDQQTDLDEDGFSLTGADFSVFLSMFGQEPGPSGIPCANVNNPAGACP